MKKNNGNERTVTGLLGIRMNCSRGKTVRREGNDELDLHRYIYCKSKSIAKRFLQDAEAEGFAFGDGTLPTTRETSDIFALCDDFTISYTGYIGRMAFYHGGSAANIVRIDYGKYLAGEDDFFYVKS